MLARQPPRPTSMDVSSPAVPVPTRRGVAHFCCWDACLSNEACSKPMPLSCRSKSRPWVHPHPAAPHC